MFLIGVIAYLVIIGLTITFGASVSSFIDWISIFFVMGCNAAILIATKSSKDFWYGLKVLCSTKPLIDKGRLSRSIDVIKLLLKSAVGIGIIGFMVGSITTLKYLAEPSSLGSFLAIPALVVFYSALLSFVILVPAEYRLKLLSSK